LTPGATVGIPKKPMGGGVGKKEGAGHPPTSPVVSPEGFLLLVPRGWRPGPGRRPRSPVPGRTAVGRPRSAGGSCSRRSGVHLWAARPDARTLSGAVGSRGAEGVPGSSMTTDPPPGAPTPPPTTPATLAHSLPRPEWSGGPSYRRVGVFGAFGASKAKRRGLGTRKYGMGTVIPAILRSLQNFQLSVCGLLLRQSATLLRLWPSGLVGQLTG